MAEGYPDNCPRCQAPLEEDTGFNRVVGLSDSDSIRAWQCPDCGHTWPRTERPEPGFRRCNVVWVREKRDDR